MLLCAMSDAGEADPAPPLPSGVVVGRHTYGHGAATFQIFIRGARIEVGPFCSIGPQVRILAGSDHVTTRATTFPLDALLFNPGAGNRLEAIDKGTTVIGPDVWLGLGAIVLSGVLVGAGAVIGAGAVVSKSVPPYAVVVGNPARIVRYRFDAETRRRLLALSWWDWDDAEIHAFRERFFGDVEALLDAGERAHGSRPESDLTRRLRAMPPELLTPGRGPGTETAEHSRIRELEEQLAGMRSTAAWRWAMRYWRLRARLRRSRTRH